MHPYGATPNPRYTGKGSFSGLRQETAAFAPRITLYLDIRTNLPGYYSLLRKVYTQ